MSAVIDIRDIIEQAERTEEEDFFIIPSVALRYMDNCLTAFRLAMPYVGGFVVEFEVDEAVLTDGVYVRVGDITAKKWWSARWNGSIYLWPGDAISIRFGS